MDGIYVIRINVGSEKLPAQAVVSSYKSLKFVEQDIRDTRTELQCGRCFTGAGGRVRRHAFPRLLVQYVRWHMMRAFQPPWPQEKEYPSSGL